MQKAKIQKPKAQKQSKSRMEECSHTPKVSKEEVIAKLKDDGDFDRLRRNIIQKLKHNEELRENIISVVKQSAALNAAGAENMKPRQLSDAIYQEVGDKVMSQISDGLWGIIRSSDGIQSEITETVQSVYNKLTNPKEKAEGESSTHVIQVQKEADTNGSVVGTVNKKDDMLSDHEPKEPPGFCISLNHQKNNNDELQLPPPHGKGAVAEQLERAHQLQNKLDPDDVKPGLAPGFSTDMEHTQACDNNDEDPDVPPGFG